MAAQQLLACPPWEVQQAYFRQLAADMGGGVQVEQAAGMGKGLFAAREFVADEVILREAPLVGAQHSQNKKEALVCSFCFRFIGSIRLQIQQLLSSCSLVENRCCAENDTTTSLPHAALALLELLDKDRASLPHEEKFPLPAVVNCPGGCGERFCSHLCLGKAWEAYHSLLCVESGLCRNKDALVLFKEFADATNDIFHLASQVIANVLCRARKVGLAEAWKPYSMGHKRLWWEAIALPDDVVPEDEASFRQSMKEMASDSLSLLRTALCEEDHDECAALFSLDVYGHIIGMFELNNVEIVVASPVEDYFLCIDALDPLLKEQAEQVTRPLLDALGDKYATICQGTGFFALHSCINHSCTPNAKAFKRDQDADGDVVVIANRAIAKGEQILVSYIDEDGSYSERKSWLADYGFECQCPRCCCCS